MSLAEEAFFFLAEQRDEPSRWGRPMTYSVVMHLALLLCVPVGLQMQAKLPPPEPVRVWEIRVMGAKDLALKGTGNDFSVGPRPEKILATPPRSVSGPKRRGAARIARTVGISPKAPREVPRLAAAGPIFGRSLRVAEAGVGREKIYVSGSAARLPGPPRGGGPAGERLAGAPGDAIDLRPKGGVDGAPGGTGRYIGGGEGSINGGASLQRKGESILVDYPSQGQAPLVAKRETVDMPEAPDTFFSIRGPLSHRKILSMSLPKYPRWAEESGVEAQISMKLFVTPNGVVKPDIWIEQTSGYPEFDEVAREAVLGIKFAPLSRGEFQHEQWGVATFNFRLKNAAQRGFR
ncbi:MAG TPA: hypothetical protein DEB40_00200 [Elusimicrobia bacterium]|nr:hypothetical protein [Elusimicrobiota bacterium]HBT60154.1 hypothetical protein [Elusimicrobiota bacterium]